MSKIDDPVRWERILRIVPPDDAEWLSSRFEQPWQVARRRKEARTQALGAAWPVLAPDQPVTPASRTIARDLSRYLGCSAWAEQQPHAELPATAFERHRVLHRVAMLTDGQPLGWRTVFEALRGSAPGKG